MNFSPRKLPHLFALFLLLFVLFIIYISPLISISSGNLYRTSELTIVLNSLFLTALLIGVPIIWLIIVNRMSITEAFRFLRLKRENIDTALPFGLVAFVVIFLLHVSMVAIITLSGINNHILENPIAKEIISKISIPSMMVMFPFQSIGEEVFFRGFFMKKIEQKTDAWTAIVIVAILFGLAHLGYRVAYQIIMPTVMGLVLGYLVVKTDNLFSSITAHVLFNVFIFMIALAAKSSLTL